MEEIPISKFKATCLAVLEKVRRTGQPVLITRHGKAIAEVTRAGSEATKAWRLGGMEDKFRIIGDIISPIVGIEEWEVLRDAAAPGYARVAVERGAARKNSRKRSKNPRKRP